MGHFHKLPHREGSSVGRYLGSLLIEDKAVIDKRFFPANRECVLGLDAWKVFDLSGWDLCVVQREILSGSQCGLCSFDRRFPAQIKIASHVLVIVQGVRLTQIPVIGDTNCGLLAFVSSHFDLIFSL